MKAIKTKFYGPSNKRGARIKASDLDGNSITIPYSHEGTSEYEHGLAAIALCNKLNWSGTLVGGQLKPGEYVFVWEDETSKLRV